MKEFLGRRRARKTAKVGEPARCRAILTSWAVAATMDLWVIPEHALEYGRLWKYALEVRTLTGIPNIHC